MDKPKQVIEVVYRFANGMCIVFDKDGKQIPEYQGRWEDMKHKIIKDLPDKAEIKKTVNYR